MPKAKPILFSTPMVQALLDGRKTQTRRVVKLPKDRGQWEATTVGGIGVTDRYGRPTQEHVAIWNTTTGSCIACPIGKVGDYLIPAMYIPNVPKIYCADIQGNIWSKARGEWRKLKPFIPKAQKRYESVTICLDGRKTTRNVHRLVCATFYGEAVSKGMQVRHIDGNSLNNCAENLKWGTQAENWMDRRAHGNSCTGQLHHDAKFSNEEREHIRWCIKKGICSQKHIARVLGVYQSTIYFMMDAKEKFTENQDDNNWASRLTLEITDIQVERLQDISEEDANAEGTNHISCRPEKASILPATYDTKGFATNNKHAFESLWKSINGKDSWNVNPWVWVIDFKVHKMNVDEVLNGKH